MIKHFFASISNYNFLAQSDYDDCYRANLFYICDYDMTVKSWQHAYDVIQSLNSSDPKMSRFFAESMENYVIEVRNLKNSNYTHQNLSLKNRA